MHEGRVLDRALQARRGGTDFVEAGRFHVAARLQAGKVLEVLQSQQLAHALFVLDHEDLRSHAAL
jgi:hypothetical protein